MREMNVCSIEKQRNKQTTTAIERFCGAGRIKPFVLCLLLEFYLCIVLR